MKIQVNDAPKSQKEINIELPYSKFNEAADIETEKLAKDVKIQGFRPGKAPKDLVKKQNEHKIRSMALETIINNTIRDAFINNNINPISQPEVSNVVLEDDKPISFTVKVDVFPKLSIDNVSGFEFDRNVIKIDDEDVDSTLEKLREQYSEFNAVQEDREVKNGDRVSIDFEGKIDGVPFEGGKAEKHLLEIGSGQFIPGFEDGVVGMKKGETTDIDVKFPENYQQADLAGKDSVFTIVLHEIQEKVVPELNAEFAKKVQDKLDSVDALKDLIRKDLQNEAEQFTKYEVYTKMLNKIIEENPFEVPNSIIMDQAKRLAAQNLQQYYQMGINPEMFGMTADSMAAQFAGEAEMQVKRALVINEIAAKQNFTVTQEDINSEIEKIAEQSGRSADEIRATIMVNDQSVQGFKNDILSQKVYDYLFAENKMNDNVLTREEFEKQRMAQQAPQDSSEETNNAKEQENKNIND